VAKLRRMTENVKWCYFVESRAEGLTGDSGGKSPKGVFQEEIRGEFEEKLLGLGTKGTVSGGSKPSVKRVYHTLRKRGGRENSVGWKGLRGLVGEIVR